MLKKERQNSILEIVKTRKYCTVNFLSEKLYVAPITIRRDLMELEAAGLVTRCYGGATIPEYENREVPFEIRNRSNSSVKALLAKRCAALINTGDVVFLDASSTASYIVDYLYPDKELTIITNCTFVAEKLKEKKIRCYLTGGMPVENSYALVGGIAEKTVSGLYANICFFSSQGVSEDGVISDHSEAETSLRQLMLKNSEKKVYVFDSGKLGKQFTFKVCTIEDVDVVITDAKDFSAPNKK